jgi:hypothetical protein
VSRPCLRPRGFFQVINKRFHECKAP